jgi:hypothetical protein
MPRHIRATDVDALPAHYPPSEFVDGDWDPGYRVVQDGRRRRLHVSKP